MTDEESGTSPWNRLVVVLAAVAMVAAGLGCDEPAQEGPDEQQAEEDFEEPVVDEEGRPHFEDIADEADELEAEAEEALEEGADRVEEAAARIDEKQEAEDGDGEDADEDDEQDAEDED